MKLNSIYIVFLRDGLNRLLGYDPIISELLK